ncbi:MAG: hypothetical protein JSV09_06115, partial [Thermoplasmata archaeon]
PVCRAGNFLADFSEIRVVGAVFLLGKRGILCECVSSFKRFNLILPMCYIIISSILPMFLDIIITINFNTFILIIVFDLTNNRILINIKIKGENMSNELVNFKWAFKASDLDAEREAFKKAGVSLSDEITPIINEDTTDSAFEPITMIMGAISLILLTERVVKFIKNVKHDGLIVEYKNGNYVCKENSSLDRGTVLVLGSGEPKLLKADQDKEIFSAIKAIKSN